MIEVFRKLLEKGVVDPALSRGLKPLQGLITRGYDERADADKLRQAVLAALDDLAKEEGIDRYDKLIATLKLTDLMDETRTLLAATAVEMTRPDADRVPSALLNDLNMEDSQSELLALFMFLLRMQLASLNGYGQGIAYADRLAERGLLNGIAQDVKELATRTDIITDYVEALVTDRRLAKDDSQALRDYVEMVREQLRYLPLPLARISSSNVRTDTELKRVFVHVNVRADAKAFHDLERGGKQGLSNKREASKGQGIPLERLADVLAQNERFLLLGPPGSGKTTLLRHAALAFAEGLAEEELDWQGTPLLPIFVRLRNFGTFLAGRRDAFPSPAPGALTAYLDNYFRKEYRLALTPDFFDRRLKEGKCLVLLDGLDEATEERSEVARQVNAFIKHYRRKGNRFGMASRPRGFETVEIHLRPISLSVYNVDPLRVDGIQQLIRKLLSLIESNPRQLDRDSGGLMRAILASRELLKIASIPLFCTALLLVYKYHGAELPHRRVDAFQEIVDLLLGFWKAQEQELARAGDLAAHDGTEAHYNDLRSAVAAKKRRLGYLAYQMQITRETEISTGHAIAFLKEYLQETEHKNLSIATTWATNFLINSHERSGLLVEVEPGIYGFTHQGFREYLAATAMANLREGEFVHAVLQHLDDDWWEEVIILACASSELPDAWRGLMIQEILGAGEPLRHEGNMDAWLRHTLMAGRMARDMAGYLPGKDRRKIEEILQETSTNSDLSISFRSDTSDALDELGVLPEDLYKLAHIPTKNDVNEFWTGIYPVTNVQYRRFLESEDFSEPELWLPVPGFGIHEYPASNDTAFIDWSIWQDFLQENRRPDGKIYPRYWEGEDSGITRRGVPVVGITWWEANSYCRWILRHWEELEEGSENPDLHPTLIRLPSEVEWVLAAGGEVPKGRYVWDKEDTVTQSDADIIRRSNVSEARISRTTPVGMYPSGRSWPYRLFDLAGNVWEWQGSQFENNSGRRWSALRGGAWPFVGWHARVDGRIGVRPDLAVPYIGFRIVATSS